MNIKGAAQLVFIFSLAIGLLSCNSKAGDTNTGIKKINTISDIEGYVVKPSAIDQTITISGTIKPLEETVLMPEVAGRVDMINLQEGKYVKQGSVLIKLFDEDIQAQLQKAQENFVDSYTRLINFKYYLKVTETRLKKLFSGL